MSPSTNTSLIVFWFRRDLRLHDNRGLAEALSAEGPVLPLFIFDRNILDALEDREDKRVEFFHRVLGEMDADLRKVGSSMHVEHGAPEKIFADLLKRFEIRAVYANHDYEPAAIERDRAVGELLRSHGIEFRTFKDQVVFERREVAKENGEPYTVFTPYSRKWKTVLKSEASALREYKVDMTKFLKWRGPGLPSLEELGFRGTGVKFPSKEVNRDVVSRYADQRNFPAINGTTRLGIHLRFGTVSVRQLVKVAERTSETWLNELIWREFFMQILANFPYVANGPFKPEYGKIKWREGQRAWEDFEKWCEGKTGYPFVDAGMRELNETGFMHNRVRMVTASFLVKHLLIDWRWGEAYFARKLLDFELASNNGNWQWVAGCGCDAAPYFRVFNPDLQQKKFDPQGLYVRRWVRELGTERYPTPMIDHVTARLRVLKAYDIGLGKKAPQAQ